MTPTRRLSGPAFASIVALALLAVAPLAPVADAAAARPAAHAHAVVPFIDDDLPRALAAAKKSDRPIFVESWAPW
jgi:thiol:disulfide interchange protein